MQIYWFPCIAFSYLAGILLAVFTSIPLPGVLGATAFLFPCLWAFRKHRIFLFLVIATMLCLGFLNYRFHERLENNDIKRWVEQYGEDKHQNLPVSQWVVLRGVTAEQAEPYLRGKRKNLSFIVKSEDLSFKRSGKYHSLPARGAVQVFVMNTEFSVRCGQRVRLYGKLQSPKSPVNAGQFDYQKYLAQKGIFAVMYVYGNKSITLKPSGKRGNCFARFEKIRTWMSWKIEALFNPEYRGLFKALLLGFRKELDPEQREAFVKTGTAHLLAISGLHMTLVAGSFYLLLIACGATQRCAAAAALIMIPCYMIIGGGHIPLQRAGLMAAVVYTAVFFRREPKFLNTFSMALFILLWIEPRGVLSLSFQLSFLSVFSIVYFLPLGLQHRNFFHFCLPSLSVFIGTFPVLIYYFNVISPVSLIANALAIPLFHLAILGAFLSLALSSVPVLGPASVFIAEKAMQSGLLWIDWLSTWRAAYGYFKTPHWGWVVAYYVTFACVWLAFRYSSWRFSKGRFFYFSLWLTVLTFFILDMSRKNFTLTFLATGQNEVAHIQFPNGAHWLVNGGRKFPSHQGRWIVTPYLRSLGVNRIDAVFLTDTYKKHWGALGTLFRNFEIDYVLHPGGKAFEKTLKEMSRGVNFTHYDSGLVLRPYDNGEIKEPVRVLNVLDKKTLWRVQHGAYRFLWASGIQNSMLSFLNQLNERERTADVLILSSVSESEFEIFESLVRLVQPRIIVMPKKKWEKSHNLDLGGASVVTSEMYGQIQFEGIPAHEEGERLSHIAIYSYIKGYMGRI